MTIRTKQAVRMLDDYTAILPGKGRQKKYKKKCCVCRKKFFIMRFPGSPDIK